MKCFQRKKGERNGERESAHKREGAIEKGVEEVLGGFYELANLILEP